MVPLAVGSLILGGVQALAGLKGLSDLNKTPRAQYGVTPEMQGAYDTAKQQAQYGYSPEQKANFEQGVSRDVNTRYRRAVDMGGGNLASAINAGIQGGGIGQLNQFASQDAQLQQQKERYVGQLAGGFQSQANMQTRSEQQRRDAIEQAYGGAIKSGLNNAIGSLNLTQAMGGFGGGAKAPQTHMATPQMSFEQNPNISQQNSYGAPTQFTSAGAPYEDPTEYYNFGQGMNQFLPQNNPYLPKQ